jgi:NTP pyrophosphatase (non-canonical NTP hydrolase)
MSDLKNLLEQAEVIRRKYEEMNLKEGTMPWKIQDYAQGFAGDFGDLQKLIMAKEGLRYIKDVDNKLAHELSDCLWSILIIAGHYKIDLEEAFTKTMSDIADRIAGVKA